MRKTGGMRIVAIDTVESFSRSAAEIPVTLHSAMSAMVVVACLWTVALCTKLHHVGVRNAFTISESQRVVVVRVVATEAAD